MKDTPAQIASRLMAPATASASWSFEQVEALIIEAIREERGRDRAKAGAQGSQVPNDLPPCKMVDIKATEAEQRALLADMARQLAALDARRHKKGARRK